MAVFSVEIDDADVYRVISSIAANYKRPDTVDNPDFDPSLEVSDSNPLKIDNPETVAAFANRKVREFLIENVTSYEFRTAREQAINNLSESPTVSNPDA